MKRRKDGHNGKMWYFLFMQILIFSLILSLPLCAYAAETIPKFASQTIDDKISIGYGLAIGDMDGDGKQDILLADAKEFVWYKNPTWEKRTFAKLPGPRDNVCLAAQDIDGDGKVEIAVGGNWNPGETTDEAQSGSVHYLIRPKEAGAMWEAVELPHEPTVHRMRWVQDNQKAWTLVVLPLHGRGNKDGAGDHGVKIQAYYPPSNPSGATEWKIETVDQSMHVTHQLDVDAVFGGIVVGGKEGLIQSGIKAPTQVLSLQDAKESPLPPRPFAGIGEIRCFEYGKFAAIEPFHGNLLTVYDVTNDGQKRDRIVLDDQLAQGHALGCATFFGEKPTQQIVAGWREPNAAGKFGIKIYWKTAEGPWTNAWVDENKMACEDLKIADLNGDGKPDIIASGRSTKNVVIYWNRAGDP